MAGLKYTITKVCDFCGESFEAQKTTTKFCSHTCASRAYKERKRSARKEATQKVATMEAESRAFVPTDMAIYISVADTAKRLGVSRQTVYNLIHSGTLKASRLSDRLCFISTLDIDEMITSNRITEYRARPSNVPVVITDFYTIAEIKEKYKVKDSWVFKLIRDYDMPKILKRGRTHVCKKSIDKYFAEHKKADDAINDWVTPTIIAVKRGLPLPYIYSFAHEHNIPKKKEGNITYYSKVDFENAINKAFPPKPQYYSVDEAMETYHLTRDSLYHHVKRNNITKIKCGKYIKISKEELDHLFKKVIQL